ncbi:hypothetical protein P255_00808 [Acinetobacter brisouii CIP 110357]|uniref:Uncharacterized protein n=1 Tax=Acinetobacter brisouii CIP 110357 TaxID=1341683 RepID=V2VY19_9GAMM|nr:hypothetical protein [Acinetobacter brisouii]ENV46661.1 hypothetical protein F954_02648 [Acinetobacter brisouii ANC 4119]ESK52649.1 hypothetical protein P255_00808 [Acinetobacter brisouii CIP 110357]
MAFFGFIPSESLLNKIQTAIAQKNSKEPLYPLRDEIALQVNDEIIDAIVTNLIHHFPETDKREATEKLASFVKSSVHFLLSKQLLSKAPNEVVRQSITFSEKSMFKDPEGQWRLGQSLDDSLVTTLKHQFAQIQAGEKVNLHALAESYKMFAEATVRHYMHDFNHTLDLGMIKRKASDLGCAAVIKAVHIAIDKIIPHLNRHELKALAEYHNGLFFH